MRLPNFLHFEELNDLRQRMGAELRPPLAPATPMRLIELPAIRPVQQPPVLRIAPSPPPPPAPAPPQLATALETTGVEVGSEEIQVLADGTLAFKGHRVLVYIRDVSTYKDREKLPRFHVADCRTLEEMRAQKRWQRYVVANRDDGQFVINVIGDGATKTRVHRLDVCQNCLAHLSWQGFDSDLSKAERLEAVRSFSLREFFARYKKDLVREPPQVTSDTAPLNDYPDNWAQISEQHKRNAGYRCAACGVVVKRPDSRFLHVHHRNGLKSDSREQNLQVLCVACHADTPRHGHLRGTTEYKEFVERYRRSV